MWSSAFFSWKKTPKETNLNEAGVEFLLFVWWWDGDCGCGTLGRIPRFFHNICQPPEKSYDSKNTTSSEYLVIKIPDCKTSIDTSLLPKKTGGKGRHAGKTQVFQEIPYHQWAATSCSPLTNGTSYGCVSPAQKKNVSTNTNPVLSQFKNKTPFHRTFFSNFCPSFFWTDPVHLRSKVPPELSSNPWNWRRQMWQKIHPPLLLYIWNMRILYIEREREMICKARTC